MKLSIFGPYLVTYSKTPATDALSDNQDKCGDTSLRYSYSAQNNSHDKKQTLLQTLHTKFTINTLTGRH